MKYIFFSVLALEIGSFANVCIYRWPLNKSILFPVRSECPWCKLIIPWWANIPLISFFLLKGVCQNCSSDISWRYPLIEFLFALIGTSFYVFTQFHAVPISMIVLVSMEFFVFTMTVTTFTDFDWKIIPDQPLIVALCLGLFASPWNPILEGDGLINSIQSAVLGTGVSSLALFVIMILGKWFLGRDAIGMGDVKLLGVFGAFLGIENSFHVLFLSSLIGGVFAFMGLKLGYIKRHHYIPFAPFLNLSAFIILVRCLIR